MDPATLISAGGAVAGGLLGGQEQDVKYAPGQIAAGRLMRQIGNRDLDYVGPQEITQDAFDQAQNMDMDISPALNYTQKVLSGGFMQDNPYLDQQFDRASGQVRNKLDTQFAQAGRYGAGAHEAAMADQYNNLATDIYGQNYQRERQRMESAAGRLPSIQGQGVNNLQGLLGVGQTQDQIADEAANWDVYEKANRLKMMQAGQGMTPQPMHQNQAAGALGGALQGFQLGDQVGGLLE